MSGRDDLLQPVVLILELTHALDLRRRQPAIALLPVVERRIRHAGLAAHLRCRRPSSAWCAESMRSAPSRIRNRPSPEPGVINRKFQPRTVRNPGSTSPDEVTGNEAIEIFDEQIIGILKRHQAELSTTKYPLPRCPRLFGRRSRHHLEFDHVIMLARRRSACRSNLRRICPAGALGRRLITA